jgi:hypothetical protein
VAHEIHQIGGIFAVVDRKRRRQADLFRVFAQQARADTVERARPGDPLRQRGRHARDARCNARNPSRHFLRRAARER